MNRKTQEIMVHKHLKTTMVNTGSVGVAVIVTPAVQLLAGGSTTAARTGGSSRQIPMNLNTDVAGLGAGLKSPIDSLELSDPLSAVKKQEKFKYFVAKVKEVELMTESEATLRKAIELNPDSAPTYSNLGLLLAQDPIRVSEAEAAYRKAIELDPINARYVYRLALLLHENLHSLGEAEVAYRQAIALAPEDPFYYGGLISLLVQQSRRNEALPIGEKMRALLVTSENWYGLATLEAILGNIDVAIEYLKEAVGEVNFDRHWARNDPDLSSIRDDPRFDEIIGHV